MKQLIKMSLLSAGLMMSFTSNAQEEYKGSSFDEVVDVLTDENIIPVDQEEARLLKIYKDNKLPHYWVYKGKLFATIDGERVNLLEKDAKRTLTESHDYYDNLKKLLHPNGICFSGTWEITEPSEYTGYFSQGSKAQMISRGSVTMSNTKQGQKRGFGFAGKLFPTTSTSKVVKTANFFLVDVLLGTRAKSYLDVAMTNQPPPGFDFSNLLTGITIAETLQRADQDPLFRPLYKIAELGVGSGTTVKSPKWMMLKANSDMPVISKEDFRDELNTDLYPNGIDLDLYVSDETSDPKKEGWQKIGLLHLEKSIVSYGCDRRLHFAHPRLKNGESAPYHHGAGPYSPHGNFH